jgi:hypothetical protein
VEKSQPARWEGMAGFNIQPYCTGTYYATWFPCTIVDSTGKEVQWVNDKGESVSPEQRTYPVNVPGQKLFPMGGGSTGLGPTPPDLQAPHLMMRGEAIPPGYIPPLYADLPSMSEHERRVIFGLMVGQEGLSNIGYYNLTQAGFNPDKDMLQMYPEGRAASGWRIWWTPTGGIVPDWELKSNIEGLYGAGRSLLGGADCSNAAATGRYAGRKAAEYALKVKESEVDRKQVEEAKSRVYAPVKRRNGINWKELNAGICKIMQNYCGDYKTDELLKIGLEWFRELKDAEAATAYARNPHELMRTLECLNMIDCGEMVMNACLARKASSAWLGFERVDYPEKDPPEWHKWVTIRLEDEGVKVGERPIDYWGPLKENYEAHCGL